MRDLINFLTFPLRAVTLFEQDIFFIDSLRTERFRYVNRYCKGWTLDIGCGNNDFVTAFRRNLGIGIDLGDPKFDPPKILIDKSAFQTVTFVACINHIPCSIRFEEIKEAYRILVPGGRIIVTMGNPVAEFLVHKLTEFYDRIFGTHTNPDYHRGMHEEESYSLHNEIIIDLLLKAGFRNIQIKYFWTQWFLNHLFIAEKPHAKNLEMDKKNHII